jgi:murein DD-endopeptidase MepM/ murein hydrolase activator NlpD
MQERKKKVKTWFKRATRVVGMDTKTFEQFWVLNITNIQFISIITLLFATLVLLVYLLLAYTPIGNILPSGTASISRSEIEKTYERVNQLDQQITFQENYISNLQNVILGKQSFDSIYYQGNYTEDVFSQDLDTTRSVEEQLLEAEVRAKAQGASSQQKKSTGELYLLDPIVGEVSQPFKGNAHPGVDIVADKNTPVLAIFEGTVIHAGVDENDGKTIILSHPNGIISVYKHCDKLLKQTGELVKGGDPIAIIGNTGIRSTGPHLHFELWSTSGLLNPMDYFSFGR